MKTTLAFGLLVLIAMCSTSHAAFQFELDQANYTNLTVGQNVTTTLYVRATAGEVFTSLNGVGFNLVGTGGSTTIASFTKNAGFSGTVGTPLGATLNQEPLSGFVGVDGSGRAIVGTLSFTAGAPGTTSFQFLDPTPPPFTNVSGFVGGTPTSLDAQVFNSPTVSFTSVPEPSSFGLLGLMGLGLVRSRLRRK